MQSESKPTLLVISQVYVPDPASVGQHMADVAEAMAARGFDVRVLASARGYENPQIKYPRREQRAGVDVRRLPWSSFGKKSLVHRILGQAFFLLQVLLLGLFARRLDGILVSTSPPMASFAAVLISYVRRVPITYWLMDMNPDQAIAMGKVAERNPLVWAIRWLNRRVFARAATVIVLDHYMAERVERQYRVAGRLYVLPPWPHDESLADVPRNENPFVREQQLAGRFVVMYSGNHSLASPLSTLVEAAVALRDDPRFMFMFVGGGLGKRVVDEAIATHRPANIRSLPYQPLEQIKYSLSAADLHVVTLGDDMVGMIHPCKIYGAMAIGRPILFIGPRPSHVADIFDGHQIGWQMNHGDSAAVVTLLRQIAATPAHELAAMGVRARTAIRQQFSTRHLCEQFCGILEDMLTATSEAHPARPNSPHDRKDPTPVEAAAAN
jgi:putative colanic acid biosynthesis glycosyltransferase WcaI